MGLAGGFCYAEGLKIALCKLSELPLGGSRGFTVSTPAGEREIFLVRTRAGIVAYKNSCPHTGGPLDWVPDQFLSLDGDFIQCATHDALFRIDDGECVKGPCAGQSLKAVRIEVQDEQCMLAVDVSGGE